MIYYTRIEWLVGWLAVEIRGGGGGEGGREGGGGGRE